MKDKLKKILKQTVISALFFVFATIIGLLYGWLSFGFLTLRFIFPSAFLIGAIIALVGLIVAIIPIRLSFKRNKLIDHTNYFSSVMEKREIMRKTAYELLYLGMSVIAFAAVLQWVLAVIMRKF
jgi:hypothetical protein